MSVASAAWPGLSHAEWSETCSTLHLWTQVVGKIRLAQTPWQNHSWHVALYVTARGLTTSPIPQGQGSFAIEFDFVSHELAIRQSDGSGKTLALKPQSVAGFYREVTNALLALGIVVPIREYPCEIAGAIPFTHDTFHAAYDRDYANRFWRVLLHTDRVLKQFRTGFLGKVSPVHFFWGGFDMAVTRFSGRRAPLFTTPVPGTSLAMMQEAYSHEVSSAGFWPGGNGIEASYYSYAYPIPEGYANSAVRPKEAYFSTELREFLLPYEAVRTASDPDALLLEFLQSTYDAAAICAKWGRAALEGPLGRPGLCRPV